MAKKRKKKKVYLCYIIGLNLHSFQMTAFWILWSLETFSPVFSRFEDLLQTGSCLKDEHCCMAELSYLEPLKIKNRTATEKKNIVCTCRSTDVTLKNFSPALQLHAARPQGSGRHYTSKYIQENAMFF